MSNSRNAMTQSVGFYPFYNLSVQKMLPLILLKQGWEIWHNWFKMCLYPFFQAVPPSHSSCTPPRSPPTVALSPPFIPAPCWTETWGEFYVDVAVNVHCTIWNMVIKAAMVILLNFLCQKCLHFVRGYHFQNATKINWNQFLSYSLVWVGYNVVEVVAGFVRSNLEKGRQCCCFCS